MAGGYMYVDDARSVFALSADDVPDSLDTSRLRDAGLALSAEVGRLEGEEERMRARLREVSPTHAGMQGGAITLKHDSGGPRHFLAVKQSALRVRPLRSRGCWTPNFGRTLAAHKVNALAR